MRHHRPRTGGGHRRRIRRRRCVVGDPRRRRGHHRAHRELTGPALSSTFAAKVAGLDHLIQAWPMRADARILLCSSVSGLWGGQGHAAYSAANRLLDVMAGQLRAKGRHCTSIRWGLWQGTGIIDAEEIARVERSGLQAMAPERAVEAGLCEYASDPLVFAADRDRLRTFLGGSGCARRSPRADRRRSATTTQQAPFAPHSAPC